MPNAKRRTTEIPQKRPPLTIPEVWAEFTKIRKKYQFKPITRPTVKAELAYLEKRLRDAGVTIPPEHPRWRKRG